jgi:hypothetical protein
MGCGCLIAPLTALWHFLRWCFTTGWKGLLVLVLVVAIALFAYCKINTAVRGAITPKTTTQTTIAIPTKVEAPYLVKTSTRYYYAFKVVQKDGITTMAGYWSLEGAKWVFYEETLVLGAEFGKVTVSKR